MKTVTMIHVDNLKEVAAAIYHAIPSITHFSYDKEYARLTMDTDDFVEVSRIVAKFTERSLTWTIA